ncbi:MAG: type II toxin-antitoxin system HicA family toxin [Bacteroides sp.]|nr:type II toxin-antitoxin system HicA family toxin [Bacteroides sp.]
MSRKEKLLKRFLSLPKDFTYDELVSLLNYFEFYEVKKGKTSGSAVKFVNSAFLSEPIMFHKPHPQTIIKKYILLGVKGVLENCELIKVSDEEDK